MLNLISVIPQAYETLKSDVNVLNNYGSYSTQHHNIKTHGRIHSFIYDLGYEKYYTDGYLRYNEANIDTFYGRIGYLLSSKNYFSGSHHH